jgi:D-xylulose reductase
VAIYYDRRQMESKMALALVLEKARELALREIDPGWQMGPEDVRIRMDVVGICGSDIHYFRHGRIGPFIVEKPMILGHEGAGTVVECGSGVQQLKAGDRVCMEPGIPDFSSRASRMGLYNLDPALTFWATPPDHGCLTHEVVHPAALCYRLPANVSQAEGAIVEPLAVGLQAMMRAPIKAGDIALVMGAGPIGILVALSALAAGCASVLIYDPSEAKMQIAAQYSGIVPMRGGGAGLAEMALKETGGWGVDLAFECSGALQAFQSATSCIRPGGTLVCIGMPTGPVPLDIVSLQVREITLVTVFRYANVYDRAVALLASGRIDVKPLLSATYSFDECIAAFERADAAHPNDIKIQIAMT